MLTRDEKMVKAQYVLDNAFEMCEFSEQEKEAFITMQMMEQLQRRRGTLPELRLIEERTRRDAWLMRGANIVSALTIIGSLIVIIMSIQRW
jgi:hypothetical protein